MIPKRGSKGWWVVCRGKHPNYVPSGVELLTGSCPMVPEVDLRLSRWGGVLCGNPLSLSYYKIRHDGSGLRCLLGRLERLRQVSTPRSNSVER